MVCGREFLRWLPSGVPRGLPRHLAAGGAWHAQADEELTSRTETPLITTLQVETTMLVLADQFYLL